MQRLPAMIGPAWLQMPFITPWLSSLWIGLVTPVDARVARPLVEGLAVPTMVTDPSGMELFDIAPIGFEQALRDALAAQADLAAAPASAPARTPTRSP